MIPTWLRNRFKRRIEIHEAYQSVFASPDGQIVLLHIMREGHITKSTFVAGDPHQTSLNEGKRILALSILKFINKDHGNMVKQIEREIEQYENQQKHQL